MTPNTTYILFLIGILSFPLISQFPNVPPKTLALSMYITLTFLFATVVMILVHLFRMIGVLL